MARIYPLFSSSRGNSTFIGNEKWGILIDCGVSFRRLKNALSINNIPLSAVQAVFITHEHSDHVSGLKMLTKNTGIPVYGTKRTLQRLCDTDKIAACSRVVDMPKDAIACAGNEIRFFNTPHDAVHSCGYRITTPDGCECAICTDLGFVTEEVKNALKGCRFVLIEANYDENMLRSGAYPLYLKERILSPAGHLSNDDCGIQVRNLISQGTTHILLGHLSQENNTPQKAFSAVSSYIKDYRSGRDYIMGLAPVETTGGAVVL